MKELKKYSTAELLDELCGRDEVITLPKCSQTVYYRPGTANSTPIPAGATIIAITPDSETE